MCQGQDLDGNSCRSHKKEVRNKEGKEEPRNRGMIESEKGKFILTIYEKRVATEDLPFFMELMTNLSDSKFKCPRPIINNNGNYISEIKNKKASVSSFLEGFAKKKLTPNNKPIYVATPLPPLNFNQIGKICPMTAKWQTTI